MVWALAGMGAESVIARQCLNVAILTTMFMVRFAPKVRVLNFAHNGRASGQDRCLEVTDETSAGNETEGEESCRSNDPLENIRIPRKRKALNG